MIRKGRLGNVVVYWVDFNIFERIKWNRVLRKDDKLIRRRSR